MVRDFSDEIGKEVVEGWVSVMPDEVSPHIHLHPTSPSHMKPLGAFPSATGKISPVGFVQSKTFTNGEC